MENVFLVSYIWNFNRDLVQQESELPEAEASNSDKEDDESISMLMMASKDNDAISITSDLEGTYSMSSSSPQYVGLGFDNCWYMFTGGSISSVYNNPLLGPTDPGGQCVRTFLKERLEEWLKERLQINPLLWKKAGESESFSSYCAVWNVESQADTLAWASDVPSIHELPKRWQVHYCDCAEIGNALGVADDVLAKSLHDRLY